MFGNSLQPFVFLDCSLDTLFKDASDGFCQIYFGLVYDSGEYGNPLILLFRLSDLEFHIVEIRTVHVHSDLYEHRRADQGRMVAI